MEKESEQKMEKCPLVGFKPSLPVLQFDAYVVSKVVEVVRLHA